VRINACVDHGGFLLRAAINWSNSSLLSPSVCYTVQRWPFSTVWRYSHPTACCILCMLLPVLRTIFNCTFWMISLVAALAVSRWTDRCLYSCCVPKREVSGEAPANRLDLDSLTPGWGGCISMISWCGIGEEDDNEEKREVQRSILLASCQNWISSSQHVHYTRNKSCCI